MFVIFEIRQELEGRTFDDMKGAIVSINEIDIVGFVQSEREARECCAGYTGGGITLVYASVQELGKSEPWARWDEESKKWVPHSEEYP